MKKKNTILLGIFILTAILFYSGSAMAITTEEDSNGDVKGIRLPIGTDVEDSGDADLGDLQTLASEIELYDPADGMEFMDIDKVTWYNDSTNFYIILSFVGDFNITKLNTTNEFMFGFVGFDMTAVTEPNIENTTMALAFTQKDGLPAEINGTVHIQDPEGYNTTLDNCAVLSGKNITWTVPDTNFDENFTAPQLNSFGTWKPYAFMMYMMNDTVNNYTYLYFETLSFDSYLDEIFDILAQILAIPGYEPLLVILASLGCITLIISKRKYNLK